ncbi:MAG: HAD family hydrolase [Verrucomicrobiota bacterium]|nr:HAD family hydrolase [Verrucomicrobiota bacterium]
MSAGISEQKRDARNRPGGGQIPRRALQGEISLAGPTLPRRARTIRTPARGRKKIALASSGKGDEVAHYQKLAGIEELVDCQTSADDVAHSKPKADVFITALRKLGPLAPEQAVAIGDTPYDIAAAKKINLPTIALLCGGFPEDTLRDAGAVAIFRDPADLLDRYYQSPLAG